MNVHKFPQSMLFETASVDAATLKFLTSQLVQIKQPVPGGWSPKMRLNRAMKLSKTFGTIKLSYLENPLIHPCITYRIWKRQYTYTYAFAYVHPRSSSNLDPNIRLTFCDGDCISLLFHTLPFLGETDSLSTSRKTYFLAYPDESEIKGIAEIKGVGKIKGGQCREIAEVWCSNMHSR